MAKRRTTPELNLTPELPKVLSNDFNLFYKPDEKPVDESVSLFAKSLDNFVNDAGTKLVLSKELEEKNVNIAQANKDYIENKKNFRDAVKNGQIDETANPYYIEKYKELSLNDYANKFIDKLGKNYVDDRVLNDTRDGAFNQWYKSQLDSFIKENNLGFFNPVELEKGFFSETSSYRNILENRHRQDQLNKFKEEFKDKTNSKIYGILESAKDYESNPLYDDDGTNRLNFLKNKLNKEISELNDLGINGSEVVDNILDGLENYVSTSSDYEYSKFLIETLPSILNAGTNSFENIGRVKEAQEKLMELVLDNQKKDLQTQNDVKKLKEEEEYIKTYEFLSQNKNNPEFNIMQFRNDKSRSNTELRAIDQFIGDNAYKGGTQSNIIVEQEIMKLIENDKYDEAKEMAQKEFYNGQLTKSKYETIITKDIPNARNFKDERIFNDDLYVDTIKGLEQVAQQSTKGGSKLQGIYAKNYLVRSMQDWYKENKSKYETYSQLKQAFYQELNTNIILLKSSGKFSAIEFEENAGFIGTFNALDNLKSGGSN